MKNSNELSSNSKNANERAQFSNTLAKQGRGFRDDLNHLIQDFTNCEAIMVNSPVSLLTFAFFVLAIFEIIVSWKMYGELQSGILNRPNPFLSILLGIVVVSLGAVVSHYLAKRLSSSVFELEVYNMRHRSNYQIAQAVAEEKVREKTRKHFKIGIILFVVLVVGVLSISMIRVGLMGQISGQNLGLMQQLLPVIIVALEVFCGIYLGYFFKRLYMKRKIRQLHKSFHKAKDACAYETQMCHECYHHAVDRNEKIIFNRELSNALYRFDYRSKDNDDYVDEIPIAKNIKVLVMDAGQAKRGVHLFGLLPGHEFTSAIWTNESGQAIVEWQGDQDYLESLVINNHEHQGPFRDKSNVKIDLDRPSNQKILA